MCAFVAFIHLFFFLAFAISDEPKYRPFKMFFLWFGATLIMPFLWMCKLIAEAKIAAVGNIFRTVFIVYLPIYGFFVWIIFIVYFKDVLIFFKNAMGGFKDKDDLMDKPELY